MKTSIKISAIIMAALFFFSASTFAQEHNHMKNMEKKGKKTQINAKQFDKNKDGKVYQCSMCSDEISDKPGTCPNCGMEFKEVSVEKANANLTKYKAKMKGMKKGEHNMKGMMKGMGHEHEMKSGAKTADLNKYDKNHDGYVYKCDNNCGLPSDSPGKCEKCGADLHKVKVK